MPTDGPPESQSLSIIRLQPKGEYALFQGVAPKSLLRFYLDQFYGVDWSAMTGASG